MRDVKRSDNEHQSPPLEDNAQLRRDRRANDLHLKRTLEDIFRKYGRDFTGIGDEIDINTGDVVVDNGHLSGMRHEVDVGNAAASSQLLTALTNNGDPEQGYGHDDLSEYSRSEIASDDDLDDDPLSDGMEPVSPISKSNTAQQHSQDAPTSTGNSLIYSHDQRNPFVMKAAGPSSNEEMRRPSFDVDAIQALSQNIANQIAQFMQNMRAPPPSNQQDSTGDSMWEYPELPRKRRKVQAEENKPQQAIVGAAHEKELSTPLEQSLWAPVVLRRRRRSIKHGRELQTPTGRGMTQRPQEIKGAGESLAARPAGLPRRSPRDRNVSATSHVTNTNDQVEDAPSAKHAANIGKRLSGEKCHDKHRPPGRYSADKNALLVKLKEVEGLSWFEIANYFPEHTVNSLKTHYYTRTGESWYQQACDSLKTGVDLAVASGEGQNLEEDICKAPSMSSREQDQQDFGVSQLPDGGTIMAPFALQQASGHVELPSSGDNMISRIVNEIVKSSREHNDEQADRPQLIQGKTEDGSGCDQGLETYSKETTRPSDHNDLSAHFSHQDLVVKHQQQPYHTLRRHRTPPTKADTLSSMEGKRNALKSNDGSPMIRDVVDRDASAAKASGLKDQSDPVLEPVKKANPRARLKRQSDTALLETPNVKGRLVGQADYTGGRASITRSIGKRTVETPMRKVADSDEDELA